MNEEVPYIIISKRPDTEIVKDLLKRLEMAYPTNIDGYLEIKNILYSLNQYVTLLTPDGDMLDIELTLENLKTTIERINDLERLKK